MNTEQTSKNIFTNKSNPGKRCKILIITILGHNKYLKMMYLIYQQLKSIKQYEVAILIRGFRLLTVKTYANLTSDKMINKA